MTLRQILCAIRPSGHDWQMDVELAPEAPALFVRCLACGHTSSGVQWHLGPVPTRKVA